jgi:hypothetical protein
MIRVTINDSIIHLGRAIGNGVYHTRCGRYTNITRTRGYTMMHFQEVGHRTCKICMKGEKKGV